MYSTYIHEEWFCHKYKLFWLSYRTYNKENCSLFWVEEKQELVVDCMKLTVSAQERKKTILYYDFYMSP